LHPDHRQSRAVGPEWFHEIKYDGYRVERDGDNVRLITRGRYDWTQARPMDR
jgi:bifunctional non-homologous end joining protein LigD